MWLKFNLIFWFVIYCNTQHNICKRVTIWLWHAEKNTAKESELWKVLVNKVIILQFYIIVVLFLCGKQINSTKENACRMVHFDCAVGYCLLHCIRLFYECVPDVKRNLGLKMMPFIFEWKRLKHLFTATAAYFRRHCDMKSHYFLKRNPRILRK